MFDRPLEFLNWEAPVDKGQPESVTEAIAQNDAPELVVSKNLEVHMAASAV